MARKPLRPLIRSGGFYPSRKWTPLVYAGGYTTANGGEEPTPPPIEKTVTGNPIHILDALAKPAQALSVKLEPVQAGSGDPSPDNIRPISGHTDADVTRTGKNLLDPNTTVYQRYQRDLGGGIYTWKESYDSTSIAVPVKPNTTYTLSGYPTNSQMYRLGVLHGDLPTGSEEVPIYSVVRAISYAEFGETKTYTTDAEATYLIIQLSEDVFTNFLANSQLELGSTATAYEPYSGTTYPIPLGTTVYGGTLDALTGVLTVDRSMVDLGTLNWVYDSTNTRFYTIGLISVIKKGASGWLTSLICSQYKTANGTAENGTISEYAPTGYIYIKDTAYADAAAFKTAMSGVQLVYELATPQIIQLTAQQVELLLGENNIWSDGEMTLAYLADGNASDVEALNILLGGRYVNNHEADEPTDREALDILLGRTK